MAARTGGFFADVIAFAVYMGLWFPDVAPWIWSLGITLIIAGLNLCAVRMFGELVSGCRSSRWSRSSR